MKHTHTQARTQIFSMTFYCGECTTQTSPDAFVGRRSDALLLRQWTDGCHIEVKAVLSSLHHSALSVGATENPGQHYYFQASAPSPYITLYYYTPHASNLQFFSFSPPAPFHPKLC